jgi:hypothetical protein
MTAQIDQLVLIHQMGIRVMVQSFYSQDPAAIYVPDVQQIQLSLS